MKNKKNIDLAYLKEKLPEFIIRSKIKETLENILPFVYSKKTMEYYDNNNKGPKKIRIGSKTIVYKKDDFIAWMEQQMHYLN
ncbi:helix-turn-helix transcriptional regulator [Solidesulfovibrio alcoholivorans]|uniref:helix-turn-helix transcriptional regulator n=1 Tax=Solidesulfovibrio alcoholivorans TaxID=81406 RepID=UPI000AF7E3A6|nr:hypothetical protein [Solidesulfovibrio alcoholivorans]